jgi:hypothetical protein
VQRARHGRIRRGLGRLRPYPRTHQHHAAQVEILYNEYNFVAASPSPRFWQASPRHPGRKVPPRMATRRRPLPARRH